MALLQGSLVNYVKSGKFMLTLRLGRSNIKEEGGDSLNIKERREQLGISQKELAEKVRISQSFLCDIEQGRSKPSIDTALKIAEALNIDDIKFFETE